MKRLVIYLCGGLGNQLFQYAAGRAIAYRNNAELVLDTWSGFIRDLTYRRQYELSSFSIRARTARPYERLPFWLYQLEAKLRDRLGVQDRRTRALHQRRVYGSFLIETAHAFLPQVLSNYIASDTWMLGYWQSPKYFVELADIIRKEVSPPQPVEPKYLEVGSAIRSTDSVAVGIRLYEESSNPSSNARDGKLKTIADINRAIIELQTQSKAARFFVFCTHRSRLFEQLSLPHNSVFITRSDGYEGTLESLWLMSQCKHHIFTNSTYYWWGAWLSHANYSNQQQLVFAADNFINLDCLCENWKYF